MNEVVDFKESLNYDQHYDERFDCEYTSIDEAINKVLIFTGSKDVETENGIRTLISYGEGSNRSAFFTSSKKLQEVVNNPGTVFPFRAIIKVVEYGVNTGFAFRNPQSKITDKDVEVFERYKRNKYRRNR